MSSIFDWSTTPASNSNSDSGINWAEGQFPSTVNNSARAIMGRLAELVKDMGGALVAAGTANALTVTTNSAFTTNVNGRFLAFRAASDNTTAATLNVNGIGAKSIRKMTSAGDSALTGAEIQADGVYLVNYSEALNGAAGGWLLVNPTPADLTVFATLTGSETLTNKSLTSPALTGTPTTPTAAPGTNTTQVSSTAFVTAAVAALSTVYQPLSSALTALAAIGTAVAGDIIYATGAGTWGRRAKGTASQALLMNAGATAPVWTTLPFTQSYESSQQAMSLGGLVSVAHGLGAKPKLYMVVLQCITAQGGYVTGDEVHPNPSYDGVSNFGLSIVPTSTNLLVRVGSDGLFIMRPDTGANFAITLANWGLVARAWA
ncbi:hypothetical protein [Mesorhizobium sp. URHB0026]